MSELNPVDFKISKATIEMAAAIKPLITLGDLANGVQSATGNRELLAKTFEGTDLTEEGMVNYFNHLETVTNAVTLAAGQLATESFAGTKTTEKFQLNAKLIPGVALDTVVSRERTVPNMDRENPGTKTVYGSTVTRLNWTATANKGEHKKVRAFTAASVAAICS